jgi:Dolichyl-phosphate-mannose-protein mannosyltransferase
MFNRQSVAMPLGLQPRPISVSAFVPALLLVLLLAILNPVGYAGGDSDDWQYLQAARCVADNGFCLPQTHWAARLTMVLPMAAVISIFGESREILWLVPLAFGIVGTVSFAVLVERYFGKMAAVLASLMLVSTPIIGTQFLSPNISIVEFGAVMLSLLTLDIGIGRNDRRWLFCSGLLLGLAMLARSTSAAIVIIMGAWMIVSGRPRALIPLTAGLLSPLLLEALAYLRLAGNPFYGWSLSLAHTKIYTSELSPNVDLSKSALFNPDFIAGWHQTMGIHVHWTIDAAINNLLDPMIGPTLGAALVLMLVGRQWLDRRHWLLLGSGILYFCAMTYGLAVHPQGRMFLPVAAAGAAIAGAIGAQLWMRGDRMIVIALVVGLGLSAILISGSAMALRGIEPVAARWAAERPGRMMIDERTRHTLTLEPSLNRLPSAPAARRDHALIIGVNDCPMAMEGDRSLWAVARSQLFPGRFQKDAYRLCELVRITPANPAASPRRFGGPSVTSHASGGAP